MGNILMHKGRVTGVVDWEAASLRGQQVRDLARFAYVYALYLDRRTRPGRRVAGHSGLRTGTWGAGVRYALESWGWFPDLFRGFVQDGLTRLGAARSSWRDVILAAVAEMAALTDDPEFARRNLHLFADLVAANGRLHTRRTPREALQARQARNMRQLSLEVRSAARR